MKKLTLFNHKGGVGKTTLTVNIADALGAMGHTVLLVDADPQCNLTSYYLGEKEIDELLGESDDDEEGDTMWSAIKPVVRGRGDTKKVTVYETNRENVLLAPGDVLLADYEEELPDAWTRCFARNPRGYDVFCAMRSAVDKLASEYDADIVMYDVGPNVGPLNRSVLLDCDHFITPVTADLFSLRALSTVGRSVGKWITDWKTIYGLADEVAKTQIPDGRPHYLGYIASAFKVNVGTRKTNPHAQWEGKIAPRVKSRVVDVLEAIDSDLGPTGSNKIGDVKHFQSLAPSAQAEGVPIGSLRGKVNPGYNATIKQAEQTFERLAQDIVSRMGI
ncbi:ParA family protein [Planctomycetes bacterium TBK1r]|uniref:MinD/ParA/CobQ/CobA-like protein n=1 Tax=Stieleria magnilauensis TaxID=2527963 RepID=A0ABX5XGY7_9BACT|nr:MinD/ParA/CobQ/CobA-like protein [Planctomycetes bacterium TBK1r]